MGRTGLGIQGALALALAVGFVVERTAVWADERSDAEKQLESALASNDKEKVKTALAHATQAGDERAAKLIVTHALRLRGFGAHQELLEAIKGVKDDAGVKELAEAARKNAQVDLRYILVEGLGLQGSELAHKAVLDALDDKEASVATVAARAARSARTPEAIERLVARLEKAEVKPAEASFARELNGALAAITGMELTFAQEWKSWWMSHKEGWKPGASDAAAAGGGGDGTTVVDRLRKNRPEDARTIERLADDDVIVVKGKSDQISEVLKAIKIKHREIAPEDLAKTKLDPKSVLVLNCNSRLNPYGEDDFARIREFVDKGGYLFTSDWQLEFLLGKVFPNSITLDKKIGKEDMVVPILPAAPRHPFLRDVFPMTTWDAETFEWHIDSHSELIKSLSPDVTVLVKSPELEKREGNGAVAVTFRWHNGRVATGGESSKKQATGGSAGKAPAPEGGCVLHVLGHFKHQKDANSGDHFALQQLLLNFFLEKQHLKSGA